MHTFLPQFGIVNILWKVNFNEGKAEGVNTTIYSLPFELKVNAILLSC